jgi:hypothetical protein
MKILRWCRLQWDRAAAIGGALIAAVILFVGWNNVAETPYPAEQSPYLLSAGIGSLVLIGIAGTLWISADLRDEWRKLDRVEEHLASLHEAVDRLSESLEVGATAAAGEAGHRNGSTLDEPAHPKVR